MSPDDVYLLRLLLGTLLLMSLTVVPVLVRWASQPSLPSFLGEGGEVPEWRPLYSQYDIDRLKQRVAELEAGQK